MSFSLCSGNVDEASIVVPESSLTVLPPDAEAGLGLPLPQGRSLSLMGWALEDMNVPAYPEPRAYRSALKAVCAAIPEVLLYVQHQWTPHGGAGETKMLTCAEAR